MNVIVRVFGDNVLFKHMSYPEWRVSAKIAFVDVHLPRHDFPHDTERSESPQVKGLDILCIMDCMKKQYPIRKIDSFHAPSTKSSNLNLQDMHVECLQPHFCVKLTDTLKDNKIACMLNVRMHRKMPIL